MAVKIDKEALLKHRFWIMLGVAVPLILVALYVLLIDIASGIEKTKKDVDKSLKDMKNVAGNFTSQEEIDKIGAEVKKANLEVGKVWAKVFREQEPYMFWPVDFNKKHPFDTGKFIREIKEATDAGNAEPNHFIGTLVAAPQPNFIRVKGKDGKEERFYRTGGFEQQFLKLAAGKKYDIFFQTARYFNDQLTDNEMADYDQSYHSEIRPILDIVEPVNVDGVGVVQLGRSPANWLAPREKDDDGSPPSADEARVAKYLRWVPKWNAAVNFSDEAWLAQEDLWIQKEIYENIRDANDQVSKMLGDKVEGKDKAATFKNPYFEITLKLVSQEKLQVTLKNLRENRQKLEIAFRIRMTKDPELPRSKWETINVQGEPLDPFGTKGSDTMTKEMSLPPGQPRTGIYEVEQVLTWETAAVRRIDHIAIGSSWVDDMSLSHRQFPDGVRGLVAVEKKDDADNPRMRPDNQKMNALGINGLVKDRYLEVNEQARRLPVGVALIVDQMHLGRILKSFENSKFRFVINQTLLNRYPGTLRPVIAGEKKDIQVRPIFRPDGPRGPGRPGMPAHPGAAGEETFESNVELVIYGTVTIYQRFPARPASGPAPEAVKG